MIFTAVSEQYNDVVLAAACFLTLCIYWFWNIFCARDSKAFRRVDLQAKSLIVIVFIFHWFGDYWPQIARLVLKIEHFISVTFSNIKPWDSFKHNFGWIVYCARCLVTSPPPPPSMPRLPLNSPKRPSELFNCSYSNRDMSLFLPYAFGWCLCFGDEGRDDNSPTLEQTLTMK